MKDEGKEKSNVASPEFLLEKANGHICKLEEELKSKAFELEQANKQSRYFKKMLINIIGL